MATKNELRTLSRKKQSPIDLRDDIAVPRCLSSPLTLIGHWLNDGEAVLMNNGETAMIELTGDRIPSMLKCGPLASGDEYELHDVHFHWGEDDCRGSEHTVNGTWFSMEAHLVHWNRKYRTFDECLKHADGLCVLAFLFLVRDDFDCKCFAKLEKITNHLREIRDSDTSTKIDANSLCWIREAVSNCDFFYYYQGSYNQFDFPECATWIVFPSYVPLRSDQLAEFRKLKNHKGREMRDNRRKIQHLNGRKIYKGYVKSSTKKKHR